MCAFEEKLQKIFVKIARKIDARRWMLVGEHGLSSLDRLITLLAREGGACHLQRIHSHGIRGAERKEAFSQGAEEDLIVLAKRRRKRDVYKKTYVILTADGRAEAQRLDPDFHPDHLSDADLKQQVSEMLADGKEYARLLLEAIPGYAQWRKADDARKARNREKKAAWLAKWEKTHGYPYPSEARVPDFEELPKPPARPAVKVPVSQPRPFIPSTPQPTEPRTPQEKYLAALRQPLSPPTLEQMEARRLEAERRQQNCVICQAGVDPNFLMHDPATHLAYL